MTQSGQATLFDWDEITPNAVPSPAPTGRAVRYVSENLIVRPTLTDSPEVTAGNEPQDAVITGYEGGGDIQIALSPRNHDRYLSALLGNDWAYQTGSVANYVIRATGTAQVTYVASTRTLTTAGTWTVTPAVGDKVLLQGSGNAYLDAIHVVESATSATIVFEQDGILSNAAKVPDISTPRNITIIRGERLTNSLTPANKSLGIEKRVQRTRGTYKGVTADAVTPNTDFSVFTQVVPTRFAAQASGDQPWTGTISTRISKQVNATSAEGGATVCGSTSAWDDTPIFQGASSVKKCRFYFPDVSGVSGDAGKLQDTMRICPQSVSLELGNNLQATPLMCAEPEFDFQQGEPIGQVSVTGIYETPFPLLVFNQQYAGVFELALVATNGDGYLIRFPRAKLTVAEAPVTGRSTTIVTNMTVKAYRQTSPATGDSARAIEIYRFRQP